MGGIQQRSSHLHMLQRGLGRETHRGECLRAADRASQMPSWPNSVSLPAEQMCRASVNIWTLIPGARQEGEEMSSHQELAWSPHGRWGHQGVHCTLSIQVLSLWCRRQTRTNGPTW